MFFRKTMFIAAAGSLLLGSAAAAHRIAALCWICW